MMMVIDLNDWRGDVWTRYEQKRVEGLWGGSSEASQEGGIMRIENGSLITIIGKKGPMTINLKGML